MNKFDQEAPSMLSRDATYSFEIHKSPHIRCPALLIKVYDFLNISFR